jgi:predicted ATPase
MAILEGIQIQNYRALKDVTLGKTMESDQLPLPRLIAVIGANGTGKSTLLDALGFVGDCLADGVEIACDKPHRGGFERLRTQGVNEAIKFEIRYREAPDERPINYSLHINCDASGRPRVVRERLRQRRKGQRFGQPHPFLDLTNGAGTVWAGESTQTDEGNSSIPIRMKDRQVLGVSTLGTLAEHPRITKFRRFLSNWYVSYFIPQRARTQPMAGADPHLDRTGENLAKYLQYISRQSQGLQQVLDRISTRIPGISKIAPDTTRDRRLLLAFTVQGYEEPFYQQDMSDGTLKMLAYLLLMEDPDPAPLIGIEEPENGLHHQLLETLAKEFREFARRPKGPQVLITTHAPNFVDALTPEEVWILDKGKNGFSELLRAADIQGIHELYDEGVPMGSLWFSDHFGKGNP